MIKRAFHKTLYAIPGAGRVWAAFNRGIGRWPGLAFSGWGMTTETLPPWHDGGGDAVVREFMDAHHELLQRIAGHRFRLSQFRDVPNQAKLLDELRWRHYVVFWSARHAATTTSSSLKTLVECGVCDGLTAYFAMTALKGRFRFKAVLYDAWEGIRPGDLLESEQSAAGSYSYLSVETTQQNLDEFAGETTFVKGFIPGSFTSAPIPHDVVWLHIDLNAALPTAAALETLYDRMLPGAVILFDDYGWRAYQDTKAAIDGFAQLHHGMLLPLPTGQALFFKHG